VLTYLKAKKGLLNTINTEYQKRALLKVEEISNFLISEFDNDSDFHWSKNRSVDTSVLQMINMIDKRKPHDLEIKEKRWHGGIPINPNTERIKNWVDKVKSDPFVPNAIRKIVVDYLEDRVNLMRSIELEELRKFGDSLITDPDKYLSKDKDHVCAIIHNLINNRQYESGCGISQVEEKTHEIRFKIQKYYEKYDPIKKK